MTFLWQNLVTITCVQVSQLLGRNLPRLHSEIRNIQLLETGWGLNIVSPPEPREGKVCLMLSP